MLTINKYMTIITEDVELLCGYSCVHDDSCVGCPVYYKEPFSLNTVNDPPGWNCCIFKGISSPRTLESLLL